MPALDRWPPHGAPNPIPGAPRVPIETTTTITGLNIAWPEHTDPIGQADSHIRLIKSVLLDTFPNINAPVTGTPAQLNAASGLFGGATPTLPGTVSTGASLDLQGMQSTPTVAGDVTITNTAVSGSGAAFQVTLGGPGNTPTTTALTFDNAGDLSVTGTVNGTQIQAGGVPLIPIGGIIMFNGTQASIPAGWAICDGSTVNGVTTPNLVDRFILAAGSTGVPGPAVGATGGSFTSTPTTSTAGSHNHTGATGSAGSHNHTGTTGTTAADLANHTHAVSDSGHAHTEGGMVTGSAGVGGSPFATGLFVPGSPNITPGAYAPATSSNGTGISILAAGSGGGHAHSISTDGAHTHTISTDGNHSHTVSVTSTPPYYCLIFIMRTA